MKKYIILTAILVLGSLSIFAACPVPTTLANAAIPCISGMDANAANIDFAKVWIQGLYNSTEGAGTDSDGVPEVDTGCVFSGAWVLGDWAACAGGNPGEYYFLADWVNLAYDGCPNTADGTIRAVLLAYDTSGRYTLQSRRYSEDWTNWDAIGTIAAQPLGANSEVSATLTPVDNTHMDVAFNFSNYFLYGSYNGSQPSSPIPTQYQIYFLETVGAGSTPASYLTSAWTPSAGGPYAIGTTTINGLVVPDHTNVNNRVWMSVSPIYEGTTFPWVSNQPILIWASNLDPAGAPVIASVSAKASGLNTVVTWKSSDESRVTSYQVYWAPNASAEFAPVGSVVTPTGSNSTYSQSVRIPAQGSFVVKVGANLLDGSVEYSSVASVTPSVVIKDRTRVVPN
ncbi:MAG: hypothetical protein ACE14Q_06535 [Acidobacteriota bacterium]